MGMCGLMWTSLAFADNCDKLDSNRKWLSSLESLKEAYSNEDWEMSLTYSKELEDICDKSPMLNYTIAHIHKNMGDQEKYLFYLQKSTQNTDKFVVDKDVLDKIWSEKYIAAHPDADPEVIKKRENTILNQSDQIVSLQQELNSIKTTAESAIALQEEVNSAHATDDALLWTSVAVTGVGIVLTGVGAGLLVKTKGDDESIETDDGKAHVSSQYTVSWGLLAGGIATTVIGAISSGFFGYKYSINHKNDVDNELSFTISPTYSTLKFTF